MVSSDSFGIGGDPGPRKFYEFWGTRRLPSKIASNFRRQTSVSSDFEWKEKSKIALFPFLTGPDLRSGPVRKGKRAITDLPNFPKARPRESIRWGPYCMQFWGDKSEIRVAGGLNKGDERPNSKNLDVRLLPKKLQITC